MLLGIKLDVGFWHSEAHARLFGRREILGCLGGLGVEAVEAPVGADTDADALRDYARRAVEAAMRVSMHPYTERTPDNPAFYAADDDNPCRRAHERLLGLAAEVARMQGAETVVNIHPAAAETRKAAEAAGRHAAGQAEDVRRWLVEQSVRFFAWARGWCEANGPRVRVVAELQIGPGADEPLMRIGDDYDELAEIVGRSGVPACWDFGHAVMNARRLGRPLDPPAELLSAVAHVHCHDVGRSDHQPLVHGTVPWQRFLERLVSAGFDGTVILEVPAEHFSAAGGLAVLERSVTALRQEIDRLRSRGTAV